jgi:hypothetical protein
MTAISWYVGFLVISWLVGYGAGRIYLNVRQFVEKVK